MWSGFHAAHSPSIEGLRHDGIAQHLRHNLTSFGSGWRGLVASPFETGSQATTVRPEYLEETVRDYQRRSHDLLNKGAISQGSHSRFLKDLTEAEKWSARNKTGFTMVAPNAGGDLRGLIRHERIHGFHLREPEHPFFDSEVRSAPALRTSVEKSARRATPQASESQLQSKVSGIVEHYTEQKMDLNRLQQGLGSRTWDSERIAWANESSRSFMPRMKQAGVQSLVHENPAKAAHLVQEVMQSGAGTATSTTLGRLKNMFRGSRHMLGSL